MTILVLAKCLGLFAIARRLTANDLRILCYHGAALYDENEFRPGLFMSKKTFADRMQMLADKGYPVLRLDRAIQKLKLGDISDCQTVITIDDGWFGTYAIMAPILKDHGFPATLYVATYYLEKQTQVFNVAIAYIAWASAASSLDLGDVNSQLKGVYRLDDAVELQSALNALEDFATLLETAQERQDLLRRFCEALDFDWNYLESRRLISFMNMQEARETHQQGTLDLQLHTHRHRFPDTSEHEIVREIEDNRRSIFKITNNKASHLCYPSGFYVPWQLEHLSALGIETAVTTRPGLNRSNFSKFELTRFLDSDSITQLEFEAEMSGFFELIRRLGYRI